MCPMAQKFPTLWLENLAEYQINPRKITKDLKNGQSGEFGHTGH